MKILENGELRDATPAEHADFAAAQRDPSHLVAHAELGAQAALAGDLRVEIGKEAPVIVSLSPMSLALLAGAARAAQRWPAKVTHWDNGAGVTLKLDAGAVQLVAEMADAYQQAVFAALAAAKQLIGEGKITRADDIDALWPSRDITGA